MAMPVSFLLIVLNKRRKGENSLGWLYIIVSTQILELAEVISASQNITYVTLNIQYVPKVWTGIGVNTRLYVKNLH